MFVGQIERGTIGREAFQEVDYKGMFGQADKWLNRLKMGIGFQK